MSNYEDINIEEFESIIARLEAEKAKLENDANLAAQLGRALLEDNERLQEVIRKKDEEIEQLQSSCDHSRPGKLNGTKLVNDEDSEERIKELEWENKRLTYLNVYITIIYLNYRERALEMTHQLQELEHIRAQLTETAESSSKALKQLKIQSQQDKETLGILKTVMI
jgi:chromosome segregation ATPase